MELISSDAEDMTVDDMSNDNVPNVEDMIFSSKETYHYKRVDKFFRSIDQAKIIKMLDIIDGNHQISLRLLDWFVTRYAKKQNVSYDVINEMFTVHISYKAQLKSFKKRYFDPFRRRKKFYYNYDKTDDTKKFVTTIGQLNFFRWAITNEIVKYVEDNYKIILNAMVTSNKEDKKRKLKTTSDKSVVSSTSVEKVAMCKDGLNIKAQKKVKNDEVKIILSFD
jgi:hypothetical protein